MPLKLYDKEKILDACFQLFVGNGYANTSTAMLSETAGISKSLLFHHFKSKKKLYISILERCFEQLSNELIEEPISDFDNFFEVKEKVGLNRINYLRQNPDIAKFLYEAYSNTPESLKEEIHTFTIHLKSKYRSEEEVKNKRMQNLFHQIPLRSEIKEEEAFELVSIIDNYFKKKIAIELTDETNLLDDNYWENLLLKKKTFLNMIRFGIEQKE